MSWPGRRGRRRTRGPPATGGCPLPSRASRRGRPLPFGDRLEEDLGRIGDAVRLDGEADEDQARRREVARFGHRLDRLVAREGAEDGLGDDLGVPGPAEVGDERFAMAPILPETGTNCQRSFAGRELDRDRRAPARLALDPDGAAVVFDDLLGDGKAQSGARVLGGEVGIEDPLDQSLAMPDPESRTTRIRVSPRRPIGLDFAAAPDGLDGVDEDVAEGDLELGLVASSRNSSPSKTSTGSGSARRGALR